MYISSLCISARILYLQILVGVLKTLSIYMFVRFVVRVNRYYAFRLVYIYFHQIKMSMIAHLTRAPCTRKTFILKGLIMIDNVFGLRAEITMLKRRINFSAISVHICKYSALNISIEVNINRYKTTFM